MSEDIKELPNQAPNAAEEPVVHSEEELERVPPWLRQHCFKKGVSGNPAGKPRSLDRLIRDKMEEVRQVIGQDGKPVRGAKMSPLEQLIEQLIFRALQNKDDEAKNSLLDRGWGKAKQSIELTGKDGGPMESRRLTDDEYREGVRKAREKLDNDTSE